MHQLRRNFVRGEHDNEQIHSKTMIVGKALLEMYHHRAQPCCMSRALFLCTEKIHISSKGTYDLGSRKGK
jgi:hypothetical protein